MADAPYSDTDPFKTPDVAPQPAADVLGEWGTALENPKMRASLLQFGLQMMTPPSFGQTTTGKVAEGIGAAGEMLGRQDAQERADEELRIKRDEQASKSEDRTNRNEISNLGLQLKSQEQDRKALLAQSALQVASVRMNLLTQQAELAKARAAATKSPEDVAAAAALDRQLTQAKTELAVAQTAAIPTKLDIAQQNATSGAERAAASTTRSAAAQQNALTRAKEAEDKISRFALGNESRRTEALLTAQKNYDIAVTSNFMLKDKPTIAEWTWEKNPELAKRLYPDKGPRATTTPPPDTTTTPPPPTPTTTPPTPTTTLPPVERTATGPNGMKIERRGGVWYDAATGKPYGQ